MIPLRSNAVFLSGVLLGCGVHKGKPQEPVAISNSDKPAVAVLSKDPSAWLTEYLIRTRGFYIADAYAECSEWAVDLQDSKGVIYKRWTTADGRKRYEEERKISLAPGDEFISAASSSRTYQRSQPGDAWELERDDWGVDGCAGTSGLWEKRPGSHYRIANFDIFTTRASCEEFIQRSRFMGCLWAPLKTQPATE